MSDRTMGFGLPPLRIEGQPVHPGDVIYTSYPGEELLGCWWIDDGPRRVWLIRRKEGIMLWNDHAIVWKSWE